MEKLLLAINSTDIQNEKELRALRTQLNKSEDILFKSLPHLDEILGRLEPKIHTLPWLYILALKTAVPSDANSFVTQTRRLLSNCNITQVRLAPVKFIMICRRYMDLMLDQGTPMRAVQPLRIALSKLRPSSEVLTPLDADFLQVCLLAKDYRAALPVLAEEMLSIANPDDYNFKTKDFLRYFYYAGMICVGVKQYGRALDYFRLGFTTPAVVLSAVMVECYKKYVLVSLLHTGQVAQLPKYTSSIVQRHLKGACPQYQEFANAYGTNSTDEVHKVAAEHHDSFNKDNNFGLVKQCIQALYRSNIKRHTRTYLTLSLDQIATSVKLSGPKEAEKYVLKMIENGEIYATINQKDGMVSFNDDPEEYNDTKMLNNLDAQIKRSIQLALRVRAVDQEIASSTQYLQKTTTPERHGRWEMDDYDMGGGMPPGFQRGQGGAGSGRKGKGKGMHLAN